MAIQDHAESYSRNIPWNAGYRKESFISENIELSLRISYYCQVKGNNHELER